ncbi:MAG: TAT leader-containing periplasmic protein [Shewanella sp.]
MKRRTFLMGAGIATIAAGASVGGYLVLHNRDMDQQQYDLVWLTFMPVILEGALPNMPEPHKMALNRTLDSIHATISVLPLTQQDELASLLWALNNRLSLWLLTGSVTPLIMREPSSLAQVLESWRLASMDVQVQAYLGLKDVILASFYALPEHWARLGYKKPQLLTPDVTEAK